MILGVEGVLEQDEKVQDDVKEVEVENGVKFNEALEENPRHEEVACTEKDKKKLHKEENEIFSKNIPTAKHNLQKKVKTCPECFQNIGNKNPAYGRQSISRPMRKVAPIPQ